MILSPVEKLRRFLSLEISRNCDDRAVVGGLNKFDDNWQREASSASLDAALIEDVSKFLRSYKEKEVPERKKAVNEILSKLPPMSEEEQQRRHQRRNGRNANPRQSNEPQASTAKEQGERPTRENRQQRTNSKQTDNSNERRTQPERQQTQNQKRSRQPEHGQNRQHRDSDLVIHDVYEAPRQAPVVVPENEVRIEPRPEPRRVEIRNVDPRRREVTQIASVAEMRHNFQKPVISGNGPSIDSSVSEIPGIGFQNSKALAKQDVYTVRDFLYYFPRRYDDYSAFKPINRLIPNEVVTVIGVVKSISSSVRGKYQITECVISDGTGTIRAVWYNHNWLIHQIRTDQPIVLSGRIDVYLGRPVMNNPEWEPGDQENLSTNRIVPIYALNQNLKQNFLRRMVFNTVRHWRDRLPEFLPDQVLESADLLPLQLAISQIHFPDSQEMLSRARSRLAFDEVFLMQLNVLSQKRNWCANVAEQYGVDEEVLVRQWIDHLPFILTDSQWVAVRDIQRDLVSGHPMNRLLQGDVGSGKTVVASIAALIVTQGEGQAAIMAPTGVLAEQHYRSFLGFMESIGPDNLQLRPEQIELLTGSTTEAKKREIRERLLNGEIKVIIGTHALIEDPVRFHKLALAVIDEQHRFGVAQRAALRSKGTDPHLLVMTATPIPRSLSLTIYGDLDLTVIGELPAGRIPVNTSVFPPLAREQVYRMIAREVAAGHQAFIIYPLVEEDGDEEKEGRAAVEGCERLSNEIFPDLRIALLHGRMKGDEKDNILELFKNHEYDILVSTSVIEVGVDVPNATVMVIEGANHFGLAQLHQFRGRVGRGSARSWCILIPDNDEATEQTRLQAMCSTTDGFKLAEMDLEMRGPGDFIGKRQSGIRELKLASICDVRLIEKARKEAEAIFSRDPNLDAEENQELKRRVAATTAAEEKGEIS